jgi:hypothetical protein
MNTGRLLKFPTQPYWCQCHKHFFFITDVRDEKARVFVIGKPSQHSLILLTLSPTCGLYYKSFTIVTYDRNDSGQYYKTTNNARIVS